MGVPLTAEICGNFSRIRHPVRQIRRPETATDLFMLVAGIKDKLWIKQEVSERCDFDGQLSRIRQKIVSRQFKDGLQGVFGFIDKRLFDKHKNLIFKLGE